MRGKENAPSLTNDGLKSRLRIKKEVSYYEGAPEEKKKKKNSNDDEDDDDDADWDELEDDEPKSKPKKIKSVKEEELFAEEESSSDEDSYSKMREKNIASRLELLKRIGIVKTPRESPKQRPKKVKPTVSEAELSKRASSRIKNKGTGESGKMEMLEDHSVPGSRPRSLSKPRKPSGPLPMVSMKYDSEDEDDKEAASKCADFINLLRPFLVTKPGDESKLNSCSLDSFKKVMQGLSLKEDMVAKTCEQRITSLAFHPSEEKTLIAAGCTTGTIGLWDVNNPDPDKCVEVMGPHSNQVNCITFCSSNPSRLYTTSHDGTVRSGDLMKLVFDEVWAVNPDDKITHATWHEQFQIHNLLIAQGSGKATVVDTRDPLKAVKTYQCHDRSCRTVQVHPTNNNYFVTSSALGEVRIWDQRIYKKESAPIFTLQHRKGLTSAFFSPLGNLLLTTCNDDRLRVYHIGDIATAGTPKVVTNVQHSNFTGRWLSVFKAIWHPLREDVFLVGSMDKPRRIQLYGIHGQIVHNFEGEELTTVCSVNAWHPTLPMLAGANSMGRVHVFK